MEYASGPVHMDCRTCSTVKRRCVPWVLEFIHMNVIILRNYLRLVSTDTG